jgi:hypothetical protein
MYNDGIHNDFELAHQKGLRRGFDLGWSYKGRFDRNIIEDEINNLESKYKTNKSKILLSQINLLKQLINKLKNHKNNREGISINFW